MSNNGRGSVISWWLYDWANSAFILTVVTVFFPAVFKTYWCNDGEISISTARLGIGNAVAGLVVAMLAPILGAVADIGRNKKKQLFVFVLLGVLSTFSLFFIPHGKWIIALLVFLAASTGFNCANIFYDALLVDIAERERMDWISSVGYGAGYIGGGLLFLFNVLMINRYPSFGFDDSLTAMKTALVTAAAWWMVFSVPMFIVVKEKATGGKTVTMATFLQSISKVKVTAAAIIRYRPMAFFLAAYWLYIDGVHTFILMSMDFGLSIGLNPSSLIIAFVVVQFVGFPSTILFGHLATRLGTRVMITAGIAIYIVISGTGAFFIKSITSFIVFASLTGVAQGGIQSLSRSYFGKMIPPGQAAEYFGFFNIINRFAVIVGPLLVGGIALLMHKAGLSSGIASRLGMSSVVVLFIVGMLLFRYSTKNNEKTLL